LAGRGLKLIGFFTLISNVNQRLFLLNTLKKQDLPLASSRIVFQAIIASCITYGLPAFARFLLSDVIASLKADFRKAVRWSLTDLMFPVEDVIRQAQDKFSQVNC
jgi:hypothetical protein